MNIVYFGVDCSNPLTSPNGSEMFQYYMAETLGILGNTVKVVSMARQNRQPFPSKYFESIEYPPAHGRFFVPGQLTKAIRTNVVYVHSEKEIAVAKKYGVRVPFVYINEVPNSFEKNWLPNRCHLKRNAFLFVFLGRLDPYQKGIDLLLSAFRSLVKENGKNVALVLIGPEERGSLSYLRSFRAKLDLSEYVYFTVPSWGTDKFNALADSDVFIMPSRHEGFPLALIESMACAKPSIVSAPTVRSFVRDHKIGFACEPSGDGIYAAMRDALIRNGELFDMGQKAKTIAQEEFDWTVNAKKMLDTYKRILSDGKICRVP